MECFNFMDMIHFKNGRLIDRKKNYVLISFETTLLHTQDGPTTGETCFLFDINSSTVKKWVHREINYRDDIPFVDPHFSSTIHYFLRNQNFDVESSNPLEEFFSTQSKHVKALSLLRRFPSHS